MQSLLNLVAVTIFIRTANEKKFYKNHSEQLEEERNELLVTQNSLANTCVKFSDFIESKGFVIKTRNDDEGNLVVVSIERDRLG